MRNFKQPGDIVTLTAPSNVTAGDVVQVGQIVGIVVNDALSGEEMEVQRVGLFEGLIKEAGTAYTEGALIHWNGTAFSAAALSAGDLVVGYAAAAATAGAVVGDVILTGHARADE